MKTKLLCMLGLFLLINPLFSQPERQWLIWNGYGKNGVGSNNINIYPTIQPYSITADFTLSGITSPNSASNVNAGNDIFIIYADGYHFNPRTHIGPGFFYNQGDFNTGIKDHYFINYSSSSTKYLYLTNRYEGDDLPGTVRASSGQLSTAINKYTLGVTRAPLISANHNVVYNRDITVIINYDSLRILDTINEGKPGDFILKFDGIQTIGTSNVTYSNNYMDLQAVFGTSFTALSPIYSIPLPSNPVVTGEQISLLPGLAPYGYINLRKTSTLFPPFSNGKAHYNAIFTIEKDGQFVRQLAEPILSSFDPNFLKVVSICKVSDGSYIVTYRLQFENISTVQADSLGAVIDFPPQFDLSCLRAFNWNAAGTGCGGRLNVVGNTCTFKFRENLGIIHDLLHPPKGIGYFDFKVGVKVGSNLEDPTISSLELDSVVVYFDKQPFPIEDFRDLVECSQKDSPSPDKHPDSNETDDSKDPMPSDKDKKSDDAAKSANSTKADDMGHMIMEAPPIGGTYDCIRPITTENCNCNPPFCWLCLFGGLIAGALVIGFFIWRRRRNMRIAP